MFYLAGEYLEQFYGPFRLLTSHMLLGGLGLVFCWLLSWLLLPVLQKRLPLDRGRSFAVEGDKAKGKPTGAGVIFISIFIFISILVIPFSTQFLVILGCVFLAMIFGYLDDKSISPWGEYMKGALDLVLSIIAASALCLFDHLVIWLPFTTATISISPLLFIPGATILIWTAINATNCTDGVDGLSGTLTTLALISLGVILYFVVGHKVVADYLLLPHYQDGAKWSILAFSMVGCLAGYMWYNAHPSTILMGDAGSRAIGLLLGVLVISTGNPFIIFIVAGVLLVNGGTGLIKVALLRFFKIGIFRKIRFPLHDHFRHNEGWTNSQVLIRFAVLQAMLIIILVGILIKIR